MTNGKDSKNKAQKGKNGKPASAKVGRPPCDKRAAKLSKLKGYLKEPRTLAFVCNRMGNVSRNTAHKYLRDVGATRANMGRPATYRMP